MKRAFTSRAAAEVASVRAALADVADPQKAPAMAAYMKDQFPFLGVQTKDRRAVQRPTVAALGEGSVEELLAFARACWDVPERELQYVATDALRKHEAVLTPAHLGDLAELITSKSWWDTVDSLAVHTVGPLVARHRELTEEMDSWIDDDDIWLARTAILYQLSYKERTDANRLFAYADRRAADTEFFIRKALGWALRQYARTDPEAVRAYVSANEDRLSGLTKREALKHL
ncbi:MAG: DNA alkylation repair protein [Acidimicrobiia bacterium]|nr:DNA alkylation repair protein [Acidimicrobiia bacterium]